MGLGTRHTDVASLEPADGAEGAKVTSLLRDLCYFW